MIDLQTWFFRSAAIACSMTFVVGCASIGSKEYGAYGFISPSSDGEFLGSFENLSECEDAADAWASSQVVGNPVHAECYPVDRE